MHARNYLWNAYAGARIKKKLIFIRCPLWLKFRRCCERGGGCKTGLQSLRAAVRSAGSRPPSYSMHPAEEKQKRPRAISRGTFGKCQSLWKARNIWRYRESLICGWEMQTRRWKKLRFLFYEGLLISSFGFRASTLHVHCRSSSNSFFFNSKLQLVNW